MGKTAETVIVRSFAYFSRFPPQFSPCENCAPIVQTTLWNYIRPCSASPYRTSFLPTLCLHIYPQLRKLPLFSHSRTSRSFRRSFRRENCALIVQTTLWHFSSLVPPLPLQNKFFYLHYARSSIHSCGNFRCSLIRISLAVSAAVFALRKLPNCSFKQRYGILYPLFRPSLQNKFFHLHYICTSIHSG